MLAPRSVMTAQHPLGLNVDPSDPDDEGTTDVNALPGVESTRVAGLAGPPPIAPSSTVGGEWIGRVIDDFKIIRVLGAGGMGVVFLAEQRNPQRLVALKTLHSGVQQADLRARFHQEAEILGRLKHPGIAQIFASGHAPHAMGGVPYIVMEYVEGQPLLDYCHEKPAAELLILLRSICAGVEHAHVRGVIHRDLKPGNIMVQADGSPKILDFGVARLHSEEHGQSELTTAGMVVGTIAYMSPEQATGDPAGVDIRTDVYALGMIGYRMLSGELPYRVSGQNLSHALDQITHTEPTPLARYLPDCPADLETIFRKALRKEKEARYQNANELSEDLRRFLADETILATRPSVLAELRRFSRRNKVLVGAVAAVLTAMVVSVGVSMSFALREQQQRLQSDAMVLFMQNMFSSANPVFARGRDVTVRDVLDQSQTELGRTLSDAPAARARMRTTLAETYRALGDLRTALVQYQAAQADYAAAGASGVEPMLARLGEARVLIDSGRVNEAAALLSAQLARVSPAEMLERNLLRVYLAVAQAALGADQAAESNFAALATLRTLRCAECAPDFLTRVALWADLQNVERDLALGNRDAAETKLAALAAGAIAALDATDPDVLRIGVLQARLRADAGDTASAAKMFDASYRERLRLLGPGHWQTISVANDRALFTQQQGDFAGALEQFRAALAASSELDAGNPTLSALKSNLGQLLFRQGEKPEGLALLQEAYDRQSTRLGLSHPLTQQTALNLAIAYTNLGEFEQAQPLMEAALRGAEERFGDRHRNTIAVRSEYAAFLRDRGQYPAADALFAICWEQAQQLLAAGDDDRLRVLYQYSGSLQRQKDFAGALALSTQLMAESALATGSESPYVLLAPLRHARSLMGLARYDDAKTLLVALYERLDASNAQMRGMTKNSLIELYTAQGDQVAIEALNAAH